MIITRTPLRISFFGGGTDFPEYFLEHEGLVLSTAINRYCYFHANTFPSRLVDYSIRLSYSRSELVKSISEIQHPVFRACLHYVGINSNIELHAVSDLPAFTGLGSSSSFTVGLLHTLHTVQNDRVIASMLAREAIHVERTLLKEHIGLQDQVAAAYGGFNIIEFSKNAEPRVRHVGISIENLLYLQSHLLLIFTKIKRRAQDIEKDKLMAIKKNLTQFDAMKKIVAEALKLIETKGTLDIIAFSRLLHESWESKQKLSNLVANETIKEYYSRGLKQGAYGGKLLGAGGGGFLLFIAPPDRHQHIKKAFPGHYAINIKIGVPGSEVIFSTPLIHEL